MFRIILMCLLTCCSSFMPLKQSENNICEDHTQVVEEKAKLNTFHEQQYQIIYSISSLASDSYWGNMYSQLQQDNLIFLGGTEQLSMYSVRTGTTWNASSTLLSGFYFYELDINGDLSQRSQDLVTLTSASFSCSTSGVRFNMTLTLGGTCTFFVLGVTYTYNFTITFVSTTNGSTEFNNYYTLTGSCPYWNQYTYIGMPKGANGLAVLANDTSGYDRGLRDGYNKGYDDGVANAGNDQYIAGREVGFNEGYQSGFQQGVDDTIASGTEAMTIFSGIMDVAFIPVNVFFLMFNYDVFGINIAGLVSALLTIAVVLIIFRFIAGRKV